MLIRDMDNIFIDLTSKNSYFNCLEPQGSWLFHRFGKRNFLNEELGIQQVREELLKLSYVLDLNNLTNATCLEIGL